MLWARRIKMKWRCRLDERRQGATPALVAFESLATSLVCRWAVRLYSVSGLNQRVSALHSAPLNREL